MIDLLASYGATRSVEILAYHGDLRTAAAVFAANLTLAENPHALENAAGQGPDQLSRAGKPTCIFILVLGLQAPQRWRMPITSEHRPLAAFSLHSRSYSCDGPSPCDCGKATQGRVACAWQVGRSDDRRRVAETPEHTGEVIGANDAYPLQRRRAVVRASVQFPRHWHMMCTFLLAACSSPFTSDCPPAVFGNLDIKWALAGPELFILQARPIVAGHQVADRTPIPLSDKREIEP